MLTRMRISRLFTFGLAMALSVAALTGCGPNESILKSGSNDAPSAERKTEPTKTSFESELEAMRTAQFSFIYVLRRKDGGPIDAEDRSVIRTQTTQANRRVSTDDGKAIIIGSNFQIAPHNMSVMSQRFAVENYSPAPGQPAVPLPSNSVAPEPER